MPKRVATKEKPAQEPQQTAVVTAPAPIANGVAVSRSIVYEHLQIRERSIASDDGPLKPDEVRTLLGWETEKEFQERMVKEKPGSKPEHFVYGEKFHCKNAHGAKVRTNNNANNRPFDDGWCESLIHTLLHGQWAGPFTIPGETVNGETVRISRYGQTLSGQHQMTAVMLADEYLKKARVQLGREAADTKYPTWKDHEHLFLETILITGLSEDPKVLMTIDYVKPRTSADVFYTSEVFKKCTPPERKELCRMLAAAVDLMWVRTDARGYKTHPEIVGLLERHKTLLRCVEHIFKENGTEGGRKISKYHISAGQCAALLYLMASSGPETDGDVYRNESPPTEKGLDFSYLDKAEEFWVCFASSNDFRPVRMALAKLFESEPDNDDNQGMGGRMAEKLAIIAAAWEQFKDHPDSTGPAFNDQDLADGGILCLTYSDLDDKGNKLPDGKIKLINTADFYGIDCPQVIESKTVMKEDPDPPAPDEGELEKRKEEELKRREKAMQKIEDLRKNKKK